MLTTVLENEGAERTIASWAFRQLEPWERFSFENFEKDCDLLNKSCFSIFVYDFSKTDVILRSKPPEAVLKLENDEHMYSIRSRIYLDFFKCLQIGNDKPFSIAVNVADEAPDSPDFPVFSFQKERGFSNILIPDLDFIENDYYQMSYEDTIPYEKKKTHAIFVGSTTGLPNMTLLDVQGSNIPRLRAARYFRDRTEATFLLPRIVQASMPGVENYLRAEGFGGALVSWHDQLLNKFIISMDGNGATCSRVYLSLHSNSVMLKYSSIHELFYFRGLKPGIHFLPVEKDEDVIRFVALETASPSLFADISKNGKNFVKEFLSKPAIFEYSRILIQKFSRVAESHASVRRSEN